MPFSFRSLTISSTTLLPTPLTAASPNNILSLLAENPEYPSLIFGGRTLIPKFHTAAIYNGIFLGLPMTDDIKAAIYSTG